MYITAKTKLLYQQSMKTIYAVGANFTSLSHNVLQALCSLG